MHRPGDELDQTMYGKEAGDVDVGRADCSGAVAALYRAGCNWSVYVRQQCEPSHLYHIQSWVGGGVPGILSSSASRFSPLLCGGQLDPSPDWTESLIALQPGTLLLCSTACSLVPSLLLHLESSCLPPHRSILV